MAKLCIIGAGSTVFTKHIVTDLLLLDDFKNLEIALVDIDPERLELTAKVLGALAQQLGAQPKLTTHAERRDGLPGSDFVLTAIQVGGYKPATVIDFEIPEKYGLRQTIADTLGIGGVMRALRTIPVLLDIAADVAELCPQATWLQYVNPMVMNMMAIDARYPELKAVGLCHSVQGTAAMLARDLGEKFEDIDFECAGINHMAFYTRFAKKADGGAGEDLYPRLRQVAQQILANERTSTRTEEPMDHGKLMPEKVRYEMLMRLGYFVTESSEHFSEYVPWFIKSHQPGLVEEFGIPLNDYIDRCEYATTKWQNIAKRMDDEQLPAERSDEYASHIAHAIAGGPPAVFNGNVANRDLLIPNLPADACVEVPCDVDAKGIRPRRVEALPAHLAALMRTNLNVQELTVKAVLEGNREHVYHAAMLDPHTAAELSLDQIWKMVDELLAAHGEYIPANLRP